MSAIARRSAIDHFLRAGGRWSGRIERKYNHNHDPAKGRFASASGGGNGIAPFTPRPADRPIDKDVIAKVDHLVADPKLTVSRLSSGRVAYSLDRSIDVGNFIRRIRRSAGTYLFTH